ncbi:MAG: MerR family transcriptional regulator [Vicingaceae bacterium]
MARYSIKDLEQISGIKAHTLRIWEKRYALLKPERTDTNIRFYSDEDLKRLLTVSLLNDNGMRISQIAKLSKEDVLEKVKSLEDENLQNQKRINDLVASMVDLDEPGFKSNFDHFVSEIGFEKTLKEVIYPFLEKVGILWLSDEVQPTHEHLITHIIRNKIIVAIESLPQPESDYKAILFLPEGEFHELGLLYFYYLMKKKGINVYYLGQSVPSSQVKLLSDKMKPDWIFSYSIIRKKPQIESFLQEMNQFTARETFFLENKYQQNWNIKYPKEISREVKFESLLKKVG